MSIERRLVAWSKSDPIGAEIALVTVEADRLSAHGTAIGSDPEPYRLDFELQTSAGFVTRTVRITTTAEAWIRSLDMTRSDAGEWTFFARTTTTPEPPDQDIDPADVGDAVDVDLGLSPLFNTMPMRRHGLHLGRTASHDFVMAWVSVPDLTVYRSAQRYTFIRALDSSSSIVRFESLDADTPFRAELTVDQDGLVLDYPGIANRIRDPRAGR